MDLNVLIKIIETSYNDANNNISHINEDILKIKGMSGIKTKHLLNNLCYHLNKIKTIKYLEVGTHVGSTLIPALYKNLNMKTYSVDNFSEFAFENIMNEFNNNLNTHLTSGELLHLKIINKDCFTLSNNDLNIDDGLIDCYMYDGEHSYEGQKKAITYFKDYLAEHFILYVDDWSWDQVKNGTYDGLKESNIEILYKLEDNTSCEDKDFREGFWNGIGLFICKKRY